MNTILVPTDFSPAAQNAGDYAARLALALDAELLLFHAYHIPIPVSDFPELDISLDSLQTENELLLQKEASLIEKRTGIVVKYLAKMGLAVDIILEEEKNVMLTVMGMKEKSRLGESLIGSIAISTLRKAKKPVLLIPEKAEYKDPENIAFACDYHSETDPETLNALKYFTKAFGSRIDVVNVNTEKEYMTVPSMMKKNMDGLLTDTEIKYHILESNDPVGRINEFVEKHNVGMVAVIPHHYNLLEGLFHKSISKKMAYHSEVPLLSLPDITKSN